MGEFRRQPSKVWWSTYGDDDPSKFSGYLDWGKEVDLSEDFGGAVDDDASRAESNLRTGEVEEKEGAGDEVKIAAEENKKERERDSLESERGSSSSPSGGSHKSQDSGFSDSEIQNNACSLSPQSSPELSERCVQCKSREGSKMETTDVSQREISYNLTVANYRKLKTTVKNLPTKPEAGNKILETNFDGCDETPKTKKGKKPEVSSPKQKIRKNFLKAQISRTKLDAREKINQIQNQLELSFKLPKKFNLSQNLNIFSKSLESPSPSAPENPPFSSATSLSFSPGENDTVLPALLRDSGSDVEAFKVPRLPSEPDLSCKTGKVLDLTDVGAPPISSSTPKAPEFQRQESPLPRAARAAEKKLPAKTTFATIRKLKGLSDKKLKGSLNLLGSFNRVAGSESVSEKGRATAESELSVKRWLSELRTVYEAEIMTTLQSKSVAADLTRQVTNMADTTSQTVRKLHEKTKIISEEFSKLCRQNKGKKDKRTGSLVRSLVEHVAEFIQEYVQKKDLVPRTPIFPHRRRDVKSQRSEDKPEHVGEGENCHEMITDFRQPEPETVEVKKGSPNKTKEGEVLEACEKLRLLVESNAFDDGKLDAEIANLGRKFTEVVDVLLESHIQALVRVLEEPRTELALRTALSALTSLGLEGNHLSYLAAKCNGIRALLAVCLEARATAVRVSALRALATICCVSETVRQFEQAGGVEIVADILADEKRSEAELSEASAVIAQITAPWIRDNHSVEGLSRFLDSLVISLTRIVNEYGSCETLLLSSAALANLTFMEPRTVWPLLENETAKILLTAVRRQGPKVSVFIQEQAATVIANMASIPECRKHLAEQRAVVALLCFLEIHHSPLQRAPEISAAERVQQKSAIALSRLCSDAVVAGQVVELQGVNRLVRLCKEEKERNHSDGVLVACLAALRKIVANCGTQALEELNAMELVEPRLLDSFLLFSSKQESYV